MAASAGVVEAPSFDRFIGIPFAENGRGFDGCDCWGLVWLINREARGLALPSYHTRYTIAADRRAIADLIAGELPPWDEIAAGDEQSFDCVLMRVGEDPYHIGLVTRPGNLLHVELGRTSMIERYRSDMLRHRVLGFYRYRAPKETS